MAGKQPTLIGTLVVVDPDKARRIILAAHEQCAGNTVHAARHLGVSHRTLCRWNAQLGLSDALASLRVRLARRASAAAPTSATSA